MRFEFLTMVKMSVLVFRCPENEIRCFSKRSGVTYKSILHYNPKDQKWQLLDLICMENMWTFCHDASSQAADIEMYWSKVHSIQNVRFTS
jgi:hypothetical protein